MSDNPTILPPLLNPLPQGERKLVKSPFDSNNRSNFDPLSRGERKPFEFLGSILKNPSNEYIEKAVENGAIPIGYTCSCVPTVMLSAGNLLPVSVRAPGISGTETADSYMSSVTCSYVRSILEFALDGRYDFLQGWVFASGCDHLRRLWDNTRCLVKPSFNYILDIPHSTSPAAFDWLRIELAKFRKALEEHFKITIDDRSLSSAISGHNENITILKTIGDMRKLPDPPFSGGDFLRLMLAVSVLPGNIARDLSLDFLRKARNQEGLKGHRARLLVTGGRIDDPAYIDAIESQGGLVVADRFCTGSMPSLSPIDTSCDPMTAITKHIFEKTDCPRNMGDLNGRIGRVIETAGEYKVDGIILQTIKFCDMWGVESSAMSRALRKVGMPVLRLEREYRMGGEGQLKTRVQAFIESMGK